MRLPNGRHFSFLPPPYEFLQGLAGGGARSTHSLRQCCLQSVDQFLNLFLAEGFEQAASDRRQTAEDLRFALPCNFCTARDRREIEPRDDIYVSARHAAL